MHTTGWMKPQQEHHRAQLDVQDPVREHDARDDERDHHQQEDRVEDDARRVEVPAREPVEVVALGRDDGVGVCQSTGRPTRMSKTFEPMEDEMAMSPRPSLAMYMELSASGMDVPLARIVRPMM